MKPRRWLAPYVLALVAACRPAVGAVESPPAPAPAPATPPAPEPVVGDLGVTPDNLAAQLEPFIASIGEGWGEASRFSGYVLVAQHDRPIFARAYGLADRAAGRSPTADTSFPIASVTKQFTAAAILRLSLAGKLELGDPVKKHLPEYPGPGREVTIHQLLTHTAGIPDYPLKPAVDARKGERWSVRALLETFWSDPLEFAPGERFAYSNSGYAVLGAIIERVGGKPYAEFVRDELFAPAGMTRTAVDEFAGDPDRALGYTIAGDALKLADRVDPSVPFAAGAVRSTPNDLVKWHRALAGDGILPAAAQARMYTPERGGYAYGWIAQKVAGRAAFWHNGGIDGFRSVYWRVPEADLVVVVLGNTVDVDPEPIAEAAVEAAFGGTVEPFEVVLPAPLDPAVVKRVVGKYALADDTRAELQQAGAPPDFIAGVAALEVTATASGISVKPTAQEPIELVPIAGGGFYQPTSRARLSFELPPRGPAPAVVLASAGLQLRYVRRKR